MENTLENKAKVLALYWGQKVGVTKYTNKLNINKSNIGNIESLQLKPISSISDEDAIEVSKIVNNGLHGQKFDLRIENIKKWGRFYPINSAESSDYLRSKGYALPAYGLSVEELVNRGWFVITSPNSPTTD